MSEKLRAALGVLTQLTEAAFDAAKGTLTVRVITPGFNKGKDKFYPASTLKRDHKIFEGSKMFTNHQTEAELKARPEGNVNDWVASLNRTWAMEDGTVMAEAQVIDPTFKAKLASLAEAGKLGEMGVSIRAIGQGTKQKMEGHDTVCIESILKARSVDFVTYAGAGGRVEMFEADTNSNDVELLNETSLREKRPDLVNLIESRKEKQSMTEQEIQELKNKLAVAEAANTTLTAEKTTLVAEKATAEKVAKQATASAELSRLLTEAKLPAVAVTRLTSQFKDAVEVVGMKEAIAAEADYIKSLGAPVKKNNGVDDNQITTEEAAKNTATLKESFTALGLSEAEVAIAIKGM